MVSNLMIIGIVLLIGFVISLLLSSATKRRLLNKRRYWSRKKAMRFRFAIKILNLSSGLLFVIGIIILIISIFRH